MVKSEADARLGVVTKAIEKEFGHVINWLGEAAERDAEFISTGCIGLDYALNNSGLERGLIVEIYGPESVGKSFLAYSIIMEACRKGHKCAIVDAENSLSPDLLINIGLPKDQVLLVEGAPTGEANFSIAQNLMETGEFAVVVIDSVAALVPEARTEADYDQQTIGLHARLISSSIQKIMPVARKTNTLLIFVNQLRNKIGTYGNPETTTGGNALGYYTAYRIDVRGGHSKKDKLVDASTGEIYGHTTHFKVTKNKRGVPYKSADVDLIYGMGYDTNGEIVDKGLDVGVIERSGAWFLYGEHKWQGRDKAKLALMADEKLRVELETKIRTVLVGGVILPPKETTEEEIADDKPVSQKRKTNINQGAA